MATTGRGRYGRTVANLAVSGQGVSFAPIQAGSAWHVGRSARLQASAATAHHAEAKHGAVSNFAGLWAIPRQVALWFWRADSSKPRMRPSRIADATRGRRP